jgi:hypothetical protein
MVDSDRAVAFSPVVGLADGKTLVHRKATDHSTALQWADAMADQLHYAGRLVLWVGVRRMLVEPEHDPGSLR